MAHMNARAGRWMSKEGLVTLGSDPGRGNCCPGLFQTPAGRRPTLQRGIYRRPAFLRGPLHTNAGDSVGVT